MTSPQDPAGPSGPLFIADFHPGLGAYLARQHAAGYDAVAARARFLIWLAAQAEVGADSGDLARAARTPPLTAGEEAELATRVAAGRRAEDQLASGETQGGETRARLEQAARDGGQAADRLLAANLRLVVSLAQRFTGRGVPFPELVEAGRAGLSRAIQRYDPARGYRFSTFATWWIRQAISRAAPAPVARLQAAGTDELTLTERWMIRLLGREPTAEELAAEFDLPASVTARPPRRGG